jgi:hypothetical protein
MSTQQYDALIRKGIEPDLYEISGSLKQYQKDIQLLAGRFTTEFARLKKTPAGRRQLKRASLGKQ